MERTQEPRWNGDGQHVLAMSNRSVEEPHHARTKHGIKARVRVTRKELIVRVNLPDLENY